MNERLPQLGAEVIHKTLGKGKVVASGAGAVTINFSGSLKKYSSLDVVNGIIKTT